jgi:hemolysin activation/secretion protein
MNTSFSNRYRNYLNSRTFTGGDDRLRGYPSNFFFGKDTVFFNLEYRSRGIDIMKLQVGGVLFYDVGDAAQGFDMLRPKQSVGFGIRTLIPQLNRLVFRFDLAFPMNRGPFPETGIPTPVDPVGFFFAFDQAFRP